MVLAHRSLVVSSLSVLAVGLAACGGSPSVSSLNAAGASFPAKVYQSWFADLAGSGGLKVNYQAVGSGSGRKAFIDGTVDFAASDDPIKEADRKQVSRGVVQIPMVGGTIALRIQQAWVASFSSPSSRLWGWPLAGSVIGKSLVVTRARSPGCIARMDPAPPRPSPIPLQTFSADWTLGSGKSVKWPVGVGAKGNSGVAASDR